MSIPVAVEDLERALGDFGAGYLLSTSVGGRVKAVTVEPVVVDGRLRIAGPGRGSTTNIETQPQVTLIFPPLRPWGYTLIVDGIAESLDGDVLVSPGSAVLHRPAVHADSAVYAEGCGHDCRPVDGSIGA